MKILMMSETDPAGMGIAFTNAINEHTEHTCRLITTAEKYCFGFEKDIHLDKFSQNTDEEISCLLRNADIIHFHILADEDIHFPVGNIRVKDFIKGKKIVHHHHGHPSFRNDPDKYRLKYQKLKRKVLVSTPDLKMGLPDAYWMPNLVPINNPLYMPSEERYPEFTIGHSPTRTDLKDTIALLDQAHYLGINVDIIMNTNHRECLRRKQKCHMIWDHLQGYYGVSSLEGLSMGKRVVAKLSDWTRLHIKDFAETEVLPWDKNIYLDTADCTYPREFMVDHWSDKKVVNRLIKFYEAL